MIQEAEKQAKLQRVFVRGSWVFYITGFVIPILVLVMIGPGAIPLSAARQR